MVLTALARTPKRCDKVSRHKEKQVFHSLVLANDEKIDKTKKKNKETIEKKGAMFTVVK